jgi:hypothetical protein
VAILQTKTCPPLDIYGASVVEMSMHCGLELRLVACKLVLHE